MEPPLKDLTFPLRSTLVGSVIVSAGLAITLTLGFIGYPAYTKAKNAIKDLWKDLAIQVSQTATEEVLRYFQSAPITLRFIEGLVEEEQLGVENLETIFDICYRALKENPDFVTVYYAKANGTFYGVFKIADTFLGSYRTIVSIGKTLVQNYHIGPGNKWVLTNEETTDYDPRTRPFWLTGTQHPDGAWTDPYKFATTGATGYSYMLAQKGNTGIEGYWTVDFQIDKLSSYIQSLKIGKEGIIYIIANDGTVIAESTPPQATPAIEPDWTKYLHANTKGGFVNLQHRILYTNPFPEESQIPWNLVTVIHEDDFLQPIRDDALHALALGLIPFVLFFFASAFFFGNISRRLREIANEMDRAGNLSISPKEEHKPHSLIREVNIMNESLHKMKVGLHSFSKYVPLDLVKKLIRSGKTPEIGGEKREITVLFADLVQFTTLAEQFHPDEIAKVLEVFLTTATREVHKERGTIDKFMGDAVMAIWGAPDPVPNSPLAACRTALSMKKIAASNPRMKYKIGINSGSAMVGNFGSQERMDYTAIGDTVNIAARLEKLNKLYNTHILIGPVTAEAVQEKLIVRPIDWVILQGRTQAIFIYELLCERGEAEESLLKAIAAYDAALESYRNRRFTLAASLFEKASELFGGRDTPCRILMERSLVFEKNPPSPTWTGTAIPD